MSVFAATAIMRVKSLLGSSGTTWIVPPPRLPRETSKPAVHALGCVRRRGWLQSPQSCSTAEEVRAERTYLFDRHRCRRMVPPVRAGGESRAEEFADEGSTLKRDEGSGDAGRTEQFAVGGADEGEAISLNGQHHKSEERELWTKLTPTQLQQQALIRRLKTLEARRDWRGVLAAMVSDLQMAPSLAPFLGRHYVAIVTLWLCTSEYHVLLYEYQFCSTAYQVFMTRKTTSGVRDDA